MFASVRNWYIPVFNWLVDVCHYIWFVFLQFFLNFSGRLLGTPYWWTLQAWPLPILGKSDFTHCVRSDMSYDFEILILEAFFNLILSLQVESGIFVRTWCDFSCLLWPILVWKTADLPKYNIKTHTIVFHIWIGWGGTVFSFLYLFYYITPKKSCSYIQQAFMWSEVFFCTSWNILTLCNRCLSWKEYFYQMPLPIVTEIVSMVFFLSDT